MLAEINKNGTKRGFSCVTYNAGGMRHYRNGVLFGGFTWGAAMHINQLKMQHAYGNHVKSKYIDYNYKKHIYYEILALLLANRQVFI